MKKRLAILCYSETTLNMYYEQIRSLFQENLHVEKYCIEDRSIQNEIIADLILLPSFDAFDKVRQFIKKTDKVLFVHRTISKLGLDNEHTGVWVESEKILAIGLAVKKGVTMHGFAFNVNTNVDHFKLIVPCGISDKGVTSIEKITYSLSILSPVKKIISPFLNSKLPVILATSLISSQLKLLNIGTLEMQVLSLLQS